MNTEEELIDEELYNLYRPSEGWFTPDECIPGHLYYGGSRRISEVAICRGINDTFKATAFEGIRNKMGEDFLFCEFHYDDGGSVGTFTPFVDLGEAPTFETEVETMSWLLAQEIEVVEDRIDWLRRIPERLKASRYYPFLVQDDIKHLESLKLVAVEGFSAHPMPTFRQMMEQHGLQK